MPEDVFDGPYPIFFTNCAEIFPGWAWATDEEPDFYAVIGPSQINRSPSKNMKSYRAVMQYGGDGEMTKYRGTSLRGATQQKILVYGSTHPTLGRIINDADLMGCARELTPSQVEQIASEDEVLRDFFESARELVASQSS